MRFLIVLVAALALAAPALGKTYDRVSLAEELLSLGVPKSELPIWTCIAEHESSYRTDLVGLRNTDGSYNHGLFQINDHYWCTATGRYSFNKCNIHCDDLRSDDIRSSVACARSIKEEQGFKAWASWKFCNGKLPSINNSPRKHIGWKSVATINIYLVLRYFFWNYQ